MQQDLLANGNHAPYLAQALTPPILGAAGMMGGYGGTQGFGPQFGNAGPARPIRTGPIRTAGPRQ